MENKKTAMDFLRYLIIAVLSLVLLYFIVRGTIHICTMYGYRLGILISFLGVLFFIECALPLIMIVSDIIKIRTTIKEKKRIFAQSETNIFDDARIKKKPVDGILIEGEFISFYYHPNRKRLRWGDNAVALLQMLVVSGKSFVLLYVLV